MYMLDYRLFVYWPMWETFFKLDDPCFPYFLFSLHYWSVTPRIELPARAASLVEAACQ